MGEEEAEAREWRVAQEERLKVGRKARDVPRQQTNCHRVQWCRGNLGSSLGRSCGTQPSSHPGQRGLQVLLLNASPKQFTSSGTLTRILVRMSSSFLLRLSGPSR